MPSDQVRRAQQYLGGFFGRTLHKVKSRSTEQLEDMQPQHLDSSKRAFSSRDLPSDKCFANVLTELKQQPHDQFNDEKKCADSDALGSAEKQKGLAKPKKYNCDTIPSVKFAISRDTPRKQAVSTVAVKSPRPASPGISLTSENDADLLDQMLLTIKTKLRDLGTERTEMENRVDDLYDGIANIYFQYPLPLQASCVPTTLNGALWHKDSNTHPDSSSDSDTKSQPKPSKRQKGVRKTNVRRNTNWKPLPLEAINLDFKNESTAKPRVSSESVSNIPLSPMFSTPNTPPTSPGNSPKAKKGKLPQRRATHHQLSTSTLTPPTSPLVVNEAWTKIPTRITVNIPATNEHYLGDSCGSRESGISKSQPESIVTSTIFEDGACRGDVPKNSNPKKILSPLSKISILKRKSSLGRFSEQSFKSRLLTRKTSVEGLGLPKHDLSFSRPKHKRSRSCFYDV